MNTTQSGIEKLNMLAAGLITALAVHTLFCLAALPAAIGSSHETFQLGAIKLLRLLWNIAGILAASYFAFQASGLINGRSYRQARLAGLGSLALPLLGSPGAVTAFALIPLGLLVTYLLKQADWQILFHDWAPEASNVELTENTEEAEVYTDTHEAEIEGTAVR